MDVSGPNKIKIRQVYQILAQREYVGVGQPSQKVFCYFERATFFAQAAFCPIRRSWLSRFSRFRGVIAVDVGSLAWRRSVPNPIRFHAFKKMTMGATKFDVCS